MKQNPGSLSLGNNVQPPLRMRRKTQRIIGKVLTWAVELLPLERSSCKTENTALLRRCSQLRRGGTRKLIEHCSTLTRHTERQRFRYFLEEMMFSIQFSNTIHRDIFLLCLHTEESRPHRMCFLLKRVKMITPRPRQGFRIVDAPFLVVVNSCVVITFQIGQKIPILLICSFSLVS